MNILAISKSRYIPVIDGVEQVDITTDSIQELVEYLDAFDTQFKILAHDASSIKRKLYERFCVNQLGVQFKQYFYDGYICVKEKAVKASIKDTSMKGIIDHFQIKFNDYAILECNDMLDQIVSKTDILFNDNMTHLQKVQKFMSPKYVQISDNGDIFISSIASKNEKVLSFICEDIINRFS